MRFAEGNYEALELNGEENGLAIYGDLNANTWEAAAAPHHPTTFSGSPQALLLNGTREVSFQQLELVGTPDAQRSAYGARLIAHATASFSDVRMIAAAGAPGPAGANGAAGPSVARAA